MEINYCRRCGQQLTRQDNGYRCINDHLIFINPIPTVSLFLLNSEKTHITLAVRARNPGKGLLDAFGGFLEVGETSEVGQLRELHEEVGISESDISPLHYISTEIASYQQFGETRPLLCIAYWATLNRGTALQPNDDVAACRTFALNDVPVDQFAGEDNRKAFIKLRDSINQGEIQ